jgi:hypothetical protein
MSFKRTSCAYELLFQVGFRRVYRARGLNWLTSSVVLHDSLGPGRFSPGLPKI